MPVSKAYAEKLLAEMTCPKCGNSSKVDYSVQWQDRQGGKNQGINSYYTERVYHSVLGDFRGRPIFCDDPERYDAPDSEWMMECVACRHEWRAGDHGDLYEVCKVLSHEQRVGRLAHSHRKVRLPPTNLRAADVVDDGMLRLVRVMADPQPADSGAEVRVPYTLVGDNPAEVLDRKTADAAMFPADKEYDVYRPVGPPECVPRDVVEAIDTVAGQRQYNRLTVKVVTLELREHFSDGSVMMFMNVLLEKFEKHWWLLEDPVRAANARAIDL